MKKLIGFLLLLVAAVLLYFFVYTPFLKKQLSETPVEGEEAALKLKKIDIQELPGWGSASFKSEIKAFRTNCQALLKKKPNQKLDAQGVYGTYALWQKNCKAFQKLKRPGKKAFKAFLQTHFEAYQVLTQEGGEVKEQGLFTGYYEPELRGSFKKEGAYTHPLYKKPKNLIVTQDLGNFKKELKGVRLKGLVDGQVFKPFLNRKEIDAISSHKHFKPLVWVDCDVEAFFLHIQGSGLIRLPSGKRIRVGYAEQNGHPYVPIGRLLLERGIGTPKTMGMDFIKTWLRENPTEGKALMHENPSYVFFRQLHTSGPLGTMGIPLTPEVSVAVDRSYHAMGLPMWLSVEHPIEDGEKLHRFVLAQDTGGAIKGAVRGDLFWGAGKRAARHAGEMKSKGTLYVFVPKDLQLPGSVVLEG